MKKEIICTVCPKGCRITVEGDLSNGRIDRADGFGCKRGEVYARQEAICPCRILTTSVAIDTAYRRRLPVRSSRPIPLSMLKECMTEIKKVSLKGPVENHQVIIPDILHTGADMIACMPMD